MALLKREYGGIQPCIRAGIFRIRIPFVHFRISPPEIVTGLANACTSYGALAVLTGTMGLSAEVAWALVVFETCMYTLNWLLGEPSICGWITPAMAVIIVYLETLPEGVARIQAMTAIELELAVLFLILGFTGTAKRLNTLVPPGLKAGIVMGAGIASVFARLKSDTVGTATTTSAVDTVTIGCLAGLAVVFLLMFSQRVRNHMATNRFLQILGNYSFLWTVLILFIVGGAVGEFNFNFSGQIFAVPNFAALFTAVSPFVIGWAAPDIWIASIPYAFVAWIISYGDFVTVQQLGLQAVREDEYIEFDPNRTNVICGIRNLLLSFFAPYPALAGPLSAPYCVATYQRYRVSGQQGMDSIYDGSGTNLIFTVIGLFIYPLFEASNAASGALLVCILLIQGFVCAQIAFDLARDDMDKGMVGMMAGFIVARGAAQGLIASIALYLLLSSNEKIKEDYRYNKEQQRLEDEETERQLRALEALLKQHNGGETAETKAAFDARINELEQDEKKLS